MRRDKEKALLLRRDGKSYDFICKNLGVPKSTLSDWFKTVEWSVDVKEVLSSLARKNASLRMRELTDRIREERKIIYQHMRTEAVSDFQNFKNDLLFIEGLMIYWGEGDSKLENGRIRVTNTDPMMLRLFHSFLLKYFSEIAVNVKAYLVLYPDLDEVECKQYWAEKIEVPIERFIGNHFIKGFHPTKRLAYGICTIVIASRAYKEKIITWIELMRQATGAMRV